MSFNVICLETGEIVYEGCADGAAAAVVAAAFTETTGKKHQPRRAAPAATEIPWREREAQRFSNGTYTAVPWRDEHWFLWSSQYGMTTEAIAAVRDHYVHVSTEEPGKLAFTASEEHGAADRQTRMKPGRYLKQFYGMILDEHAIKQRAAAFASQYEPLELLFSEPTPDDIERVYVTGPNSCMSYEPGRYDSPYHPVRVYGTGDLRVAYLATKADGDGESSITARALVYDAKMRHSRIYGDEERLGAALIRAGYSFGPLDGARLLRDETDDNCFVAPYIDGTYECRDAGDFLVIAAGGGIRCENTTGLSAAMRTCGHCGDGMSRDDDGTTYIDSLGETWCESCASNHAFYCEHSGTTIANDDGVELADGTMVSERWFRRHGFVCDGNGQNYSRANDDYYVMQNGETWSQDYFTLHGTCCAGCSENFDNDDVKEAADGEMRCGACDDSEDSDDDTSNGDVVPAAVAVVATVDIASIRPGDTVTVQGSDDDLPDGEYGVVLRDASDDTILVSRPVGGWLRQGQRVWWVYPKAIVAHTPTATGPVARELEAVS